MSSDEPKGDVGGGDMVTDELAVEQSFVDNAYASLTAMQARTQHVFDRIMATGGFQDLDHEVAMRRRIALLGDSPRPLLFGRIDEGDGEHWYIGRRHVEDERADPVVVEWRTPVAEPFYQARPGDARGLVRRRHLMVEARRVLSIADDVFGEGAAELGEIRLRGGDALLAELERARTGVMLDIVATIQLEQDEVIRAPLPGVLTVQGGPGTGKTAIGLHRAAYLLYNHPELARAEVMVVGPSRAFLGYIAQVLPSLGEEAVLQVTLADLVPGVKVRAVEPEAAQLVKGDARLAQVIANAVARRRRDLDDGFVVRVGLQRAAVEADEVNELVAEQVARGVPYKFGRAALRTRLVNFVYRRMGLLESDPRDLTQAIQADPVVRGALDAVWPAVSPSALVRDLLSNAEQLAACADGILDQAEQDAIRRVRNAPWTLDDLALIDEARGLLEGHTSTYGHVIVDEAQDLSPMQLRMIGRRAPSGSVTVLGDLAQATAAWSHTSWDDVATHLAVADGQGADGQEKVGGGAATSRSATACRASCSTLRRNCSPKPRRWCRRRSRFGSAGARRVCSRSRKPTSSRPPPRKPPRSRPRVSSLAASSRPNTKRPRHASSRQKASSSARLSATASSSRSPCSPRRRPRDSSSTRSWWWNRP